VKDRSSAIPSVRENALRYELFAIMNFNFVDDLYAFYKGDEIQMRKLANFTELIESHAVYWKYKIIDQKQGGYESIKALVNRTIGIEDKK
jgi:hypothetical protein